MGYHSRLGIECTTFPYWEPRVILLVQFIHIVLVHIADLDPCLLQSMQNYCCLPVMSQVWCGACWERSWRCLFVAQAHVFFQSLWYCRQGESIQIRVRCKQGFPQFSSAHYLVGSVINKLPQILQMLRLELTLSRWLSLHKNWKVISSCIYALEPFLQLKSPYSCTWAQLAQRDSRLKDHPFELWTHPKKSSGLRGWNTWSLWRSWSLVKLMLELSLTLLSSSCFGYCSASWILHR